MVSRDPYRDPEGVEPCARTGRGVEGELPQRRSDARFEQRVAAVGDGDLDGVGDTVRGWFKRAHR